MFPNLHDYLPLPPRPNLEQYKKQAKGLVKACKSGDLNAIRAWAAKWLETLAMLHGATMTSNRRERIDRQAQQLEEFARRRLLENAGASCALADAQFVIARVHGFESWPSFTKRIESLARESSSAPPWDDAVKAIVKGDAALLERLLDENPQMLREQPPPYVPRGPGPRYDAGDARAIIAREHGFSSWAEFQALLKELEQPHSQVAKFEAAVEAIISGDVPTLQRLLHENPELIRARSKRMHHATLLHYAGANGIEGFRQKTAKNVVQVAEVLLNAGADVNAVAEMYRGSTTIGLVSTSIHPRLAGVQDELIAVLIEHGATIEGRPGVAVNSCLANGRGKAAEFLAQRGAQLDLEGAAGVGQLDVVKSFFNDDGGLKAGVTMKHMTDGFAWACEFGRTEVVGFLLQHGMEVDARLRHDGQTGLHWAAYGGHADAVELLLQRGAAVDAKDETFRGTPLGWALYAWADPPQQGTRDRYYDVVALLVGAGANVDKDWLAEDSDRPQVEQLRADPRMVAALKGEMSR